MGAKIKIVSKGYLVSRGMPFDIYCDGKKIGTVNKYLIINFDDAGTYTLQAKAKYWETPTILVKIDDYKVLNLRIRNKNRYFEKFYSIVLIMPILSIINVFIHVKWVQIIMLLIFGLFSLFTLFYLLFKRKDVWVLEDDN